MNYSRVLSHFYGQPWAITPEKYDEIAALLRRKAGQPRRWETPKRRPRAFDDDDDGEIYGAGGRTRGYQVSGRTALVPIMGVMMNRCGPLDRVSGCVSSEELGAIIDSLSVDRSISSILLVFDSPGGTVAGTPELAARVASAAEKKKTVAIADSMAASAAYYVASQASKVYASPSALVGSIGVIASHFDDSQAEQKAGFKTTYVTAGKFKGEGYEPITDDARGYMQLMVNDMMSDFVRTVASGRGVTQTTVRGESWGEGRILTAATAKRVGMVDEIATLQEVVQKLESSAGSGGSGTRSRASATGRNAAAVAARLRAVEVEAAAGDRPADAVDSIVSEARRRVEARRRSA